MSLEVKYPHGRPTQSTTEQIAYPIDVSEWDTTPASPAVDYVWDDSADPPADVKSTVMPAGSATATNAVITCPILKLLTLGKRYRVEVSWTGDNSSRLECHFRVSCDNVSNA